MENQFEGFPKMGRMSRDMVITEKLDGTNAQILITPEGDILTGSRNRWITPQDDNYGFAGWVQRNAEDIFRLGPGRHFGEWWGRGIQRGYGLEEKRFSLFNSGRWTDSPDLPTCCHVVPILFKGDFSTLVVDWWTVNLSGTGSLAAPGFMNPEGIVIYHVASGTSFKKTIKDDGIPKSMARAA